VRFTDHESPPRNSGEVPKDAFSPVTVCSIRSPLKNDTSFPDWTVMLAGVKGVGAEAAPETTAAPAGEEKKKPAAKAKKAEPKAKKTTSKAKKQEAEDASTEKG